MEDSGDDFEVEMKKRLHKKEKEKQKLIGDIMMSANKDAVYTIWIPLIILIGC